VKKMGRRSERRSLVDAVIVVTICGLLFFSDGLALGLFAIPAFALDFVAFGILAVAVVLTVTFVLLGLKEKPRVSLSRMQESPVVKAVEDGAETLSSVALSVDGGGGVGRRDLEVKHSVVYSKPTYMFRSVLEAEDVKKPVVFPVKRICPACRNDFVIPSSMASYIVDFGSPKESNFNMDCPHCSAPISLKETTQEEDWGESSSSYF
jgi:hypothetical protein